MYRLWPWISPLPYGGVVMAGGQEIWPVCFKIWWDGCVTRSKFCLANTDINCSKNVLTAKWLMIRSGSYFNWLPLRWTFLHRLDCFMLASYLLIKDKKQFINAIKQNWFQLFKTISCLMLIIERCFQSTSSKKTFLWLLPMMNFLLSCATMISGANLQNTNL